MNNRKHLVVIPARGGSKRIYKKNIKNFNGKPMISYILNTLKKQKFLLRYMFQLMMMK